MARGEGGGGNARELAGLARVAPGLGWDARVWAGLRWARLGWLCGAAGPRFWLRDLGRFWFRFGFWF